MNPLPEPTPFADAAARSDRSRDRKAERRHHAFLDRYQQLATATRNWQIAAAAAALLAFLATGGMFALARQSKVRPYIVEVDRLGNAVAFGTAEETALPSERLHRSLLALAMRNLRIKVSDPKAQEVLLLQGMGYLKGPALGYVQDWLRANNPYKNPREIRTVEVESALRLSETTWQLQWTESIFDAERESRKETWQAVATVALDPPTTNAEILDNPLGLYVTNLNWNRMRVEAPSTPEGETR